MKRDLSLFCAHEDKPPLERSAMSRFYRVRVQVCKVYDLDVEANSPDEAALLAEEMQSTEIEEQGDEYDVFTDWAETLEPEDR